VAAFLDGLSSRTYNPRRWTMDNATPTAHRAAWLQVMEDFSSRSGWDLSL
jgi:hypothetical protein